MPVVNIDAGIYWFAGILILVIVIVLMIRTAMFINKFSAKLRYYNCEIYRTTGEERQYWIRRRRRLWLALIPFVKIR